MLDIEDEMVAVIGQNGGGMRRTISPTQPYAGPEEENEETSEEIREARWRDQVESTGHTYPSPRYDASRSRSRSPMSSLERGSASPTRHGWHSSATPPMLQPAQHEPVSRPVIDGENPVGYVWAAPTAAVESVVRTMRRDMGMVVDIQAQPNDAASWSDVHALHIGHYLPVEAELYVDLRIDRWELHKMPRVMPVLSQGRVITNMVVPYDLDLQLTQRRIDLWQGITHSNLVMALDESTWVVLRRRHPERIAEELEAHRARVREYILARESEHDDQNGTHIFRRGGMHGPEREERREQERFPPHDWARGMFVTLWIDWAQTPSFSLQPYVVSTRVSAWRLRRHLAQENNMHEAEIRLTDYNSVIPLERMAMDMTYSPVIVHIIQDNMPADYVTRYMIPLNSQMWTRSALRRPHQHHQSYSTRILQGQLSLTCHRKMRKKL